jgi:hypothetical protein
MTWYAGDHDDHQHPDYKAVGLYFALSLSEPHNVSYRMLASVRYVRNDTVSVAIVHPHPVHAVFRNVCSV